jgi:hypothetical protein
MGMVHRMMWRPCRLFGAYEVSECGDLRRVATGLRLKGYLNSDGYPTYAIRDDQGRKVHIGAHQLVADAFLPPPLPGQTQIAHGNGSRLYCHFNNLRWVSPAENHEDRRVHGTGPVGEKNPKAKITESEVLEIRREYSRIKVPGSGRRVGELDEQYGLCRSTILDIAKGRTWSHVKQES